MQKLMQLKTGALFVEKGGRVSYVTNEQMNKKSQYWNAETKQYDTKHDVDAMRLLQLPPLESEISAAFMEVFSGVVNETAPEKPAKKAEKNAPTVAVSLADRDPATLTPQEKAALTRMKNKAAKETK